MSDDPGPALDPASAPGPGLLERAPLRVTDDGLGFVLAPGPPVDAFIDNGGTPGSRPVTVLGEDGHQYPAQVRRDRHGGVEFRYPVSVIETKVPHAQRPTRGLLDTDAQCAERGYRAVWQPRWTGDQLGAPDASDDDPAHGVGVESWWTAWFTEDEFAALTAAPSVRSATWATRFEPR